MTNARPIRRYVFLVVLATLAFAGCKKGGGSGEVQPGGKWLDDMRARIEEKITDKDHATQFLALVDEIEEYVQAFDVDVIAYYEELAELDRDYNASRADFQNLIDRFNMKRMSYRDRMFDVQFEMREVATDEEWAIIADIDESLLKNWQRAFEL